MIKDDIYFFIPVNDKNGSLQFYIMLFISLMLLSFVCTMITFIRLSHYILHIMIFIVVGAHVVSPCNSVSIIFVFFTSNPVLIMIIVPRNIRDVI